MECESSFSSNRCWSVGSGCGFLRTDIYGLVVYRRSQPAICSEWRGTVLTDPLPLGTSECTGAGCWYWNRCHWLRSSCRSRGEFLDWVRNGRWCASYRYHRYAIQWRQHRECAWWQGFPSAHSIHTALRFAYGWRTVRIRYLVIGWWWQHSRRWWELHSTDCHDEVAWRRRESRFGNATADRCW